MNIAELKQKIEQNLSEISPENLYLIAEFIDLIKNQQKIKSRETINYKPASGRSILRHAWVGDDLEECLQLVYKTRGKVTVNNRLNPFQ
jgi:hypothetical protein